MRASDNEEGDVAELPSGTVTFLLTDVEGSTALWEEAPEAMRAALARHEALFDKAWAEGRAMTLEQAVAYALDEQPSA
jgi:class 3 adenylate cyclase